jgi:hypothetical protein
VTIYECRTQNGRRYEPLLRARLIVTVRRKLADVVCHAARDNEHCADPDLYWQIERAPFGDLVGRDHHVGSDQPAEGHYYDNQQKAREYPALAWNKPLGGVAPVRPVASRAARAAASAAAAGFIRAARA